MRLRFTSSRAGARHSGRLLALLVAGGLVTWRAGLAGAEVEGVHFIVTPYVGYPDIATHVNLEQKPIFGARVGVMFGEYLGVEGTYGRMSSETVAGSDPFPVASPGPQIDMNLQHLGADILLNLAPDLFLNPYVVGGWQEVTFEPDIEGVEDEPDFNGWEVGGGLKFALASRWAVRVEARDVFWHFDAPPAHNEPGDDYNHSLFYTAGVQLAFGGSVEDDTDRDGIADDKDECTDTPFGAVVDSRGCSIDTDSDGVADGIDQCANTPPGAAVDALGCTQDADLDGVVDGIDQCANTPAGTVVDAKGCPQDSDADGVPDSADQCANTPAGVKVDSKGCPEDADRDGVVDGIDRCPNTPSGVQVDENGCPLEVSGRQAEMIETGKITVRNINFDSGRAEIKPESHSVLHELGGIFVQWPQLQIEIGGHADARGPEQANLDLSQRRADSVRTWLLENYPELDAGKLIAKGYGESQPVASNKTAAGMAQNRRVEFKVLNPEELTRIKERRQLKKEE